MFNFENLESTLKSPKILFPEHFADIPCWIILNYNNLQMYQK